jgi:hypothetical protein
VDYASVTYDGVVPSYEVRSSERTRESFDVWWENLGRQGIDRIVLQEPWPVEADWVLARPERFETLAVFDQCAVVAPRR